MKKYLLGSLFLFLAASFLQAVRTEYKVFDRYDAFINGTFENVRLSHLGELSPSVAFKKLGDLEDAKTVFDAVYHGESLFIATGNQGKVFRMDASGKVELYFEPGQVLTRALAIGPDGALYVGTSPEGHVYRIVKGERPEVYFDPEETYIWDLMFDEEGNLFVATGNKANIYKLPPDFKGGSRPKPFFKCDRSHVNVLAMSANGDVLAGTSPQAYLYRINAEGKGSVLASGLGEEVSAIYAEDGLVYFATFGGEKAEKSSDAMPKANSSTPGRTPSASASIPAASSLPSEGKQSPLFVIKDNGFVEPFLNFPRASVFTFLPRTNAPWLVGTDSDSTLFGVNSREKWSLLQKIKDGGQVTAIVSGATQEDIYVFTSHPAAVYKLGGKAEKMVYTAEPYDAGQPVIWGNVRPYFAEDNSATVTVETRTGNSKEPDTTWSEWMATKDLKVASPIGRYLQWRMLFQETAGELLNLGIYYQYRNAEPTIHFIRFLPFALDVMTSRGQPQPLNFQQILAPSKNGEVTLPEVQDRQQLIPLGQKGWMTAVWKAEDANRDTLHFGVSIAPVNNKSETLASDWIRLAIDLRDPLLSFNTSGFDAGYYRLKVSASDSLSNPPEMARTGEKISQLFLIDTTPPVVSATIEGEGHSRSITITAVDAFSIIAGASYVLDGGETVDCIPTDGLYDAKKELFTVQLDKLEPGDHSFIVQVKDELDNEVVWKKNFVVKE